MNEIEGINTIKIALQPYLCQYINEKAKCKWFDKYATLHYENGFLFLYLHITHFHRGNESLKFYIVCAICDLIENDIIRFYKQEDLYSFISHSLDLFVSHIQEITFYFDFKPECIEIAENEKHLDIDPEEKKLITINNIIYSNDFSVEEHRSSIILYDKTKLPKNLKKLSYKEVHKNKNPYRLEFRLNPHNCNYLAMENLNYEYDETMELYIPLLAALYHKYFFGYVFIKSNDHSWFSDMYNLVKGGKARERSKKLRKSLVIIQERVGCIEALHKHNFTKSECIQFYNEGSEDINDNNIANFKKYKEFIKS